MQLVTQAFQIARLTSIPTYENKVTFNMDTDVGKGILGSPNGAGCGYLVAQHKAQLGLKKITKVVVWAQDEWGLEQSTDDLYLSMYFPVEEVTTD